MDQVKRKGARSKNDIPVDVMDQLNRGEIETANLVEWLAVDQRLLLHHVLVAHNRSTYEEPILQAIDALKKQTVNTINETIGITLFHESLRNNDDPFVEILAQHPADLVRCWATYMIGNAAISLPEMLARIRPFAADTHFGVREICWMAVRKHITLHLQESINVLVDWTTSTDANVRRFVTEATRPRGVWCAHIEVLKQEPELTLSLLEPLRSDASKYVQDSVGNWLNDASKSRPDFVQSLCARWKRESDTKETNYIIKKALRTIGTT
ncbi:DNA alkylation repair protein [Sphingobacterium psychroaquaticum]|uniref:DNA alkylation repair protein n=1 Tax=Sphingobacterium psychroaquaticum TaxID=561061 RepID=UPI00106AA2A6|nr:DNA alkylation repair protein [Sphingobacterium psychroaquaticum]QBQ41678.1 DNA alkylation repair protein [Sphingobacterium psychroaquaticum]